MRSGLLRNNLPQHLHCSEGCIALSRSNNTSNLFLQILQMYAEILLFLVAAGSLVEGRLGLRWRRFSWLSLAASGRVLSAL